MRPGEAELRLLARRDRRLGAAYRRLGPFPGFPDARTRRTSGYEYLARAILYQQLAGAAARAIHARVCALTPGPRFPRAAELLALSDERLASAGLSRPKRRALRDLAERVAGGRLTPATLARRSDEEVVRVLTEVRGIGPWTAQMYLLFKLGRPDVMAPTDLGVQEGLRLLHELPERPGPREVAERTACWAPLRSVGTWTLYRVVEEARGSAPEPS